MADSNRDGQTQAEQTLLQEAKRHRQLFEAMDTGFCVIEMIFDDAGKPVDYRFLEVNAAFEEQTGLGNAVGMRMRELAPEHEEHWYEAYGRIALTGKPEYFENEAKALNRQYGVHAFRLGAPEQRQVAVLFSDVTNLMQAEQAVRSSQAKLQSIIDSAMDVVISLDENQRIVLFNHAAETAFQCSAAEAIGSTVDRFLPAAVRESHRGHVARFAESGVSHRSMTSPAILSGVRGDGEEFPIEATISQVNVEGEKVFTVILRDITERMKAQEAQRQRTEEQRLYLGALNSAANSIVITNKDGTIQWVNAAFTRLTGYEANEAIGQNPRILKSGMHEPEFYAEMRSTIHAGKVWHGEIINRRKNGDLYVEEMTITPIVTDGGISHFVAVKDDITERKRAEQALRKSEQRYKFLTESIDDVYTAMDDDLRYTYWNKRAEEITGFGAGMVLGKTRMELFGESAEVKKADDVAMKVIRTRQPMEYEIEREVDGEKHYYYSRVFPAEEGITSITSDITARKRAQEELLKSEKLASVGRMAATIAHEINNPLASVMNVLYLADKTEKLPEEAHHYIEMADAELNRIAHITRQSLGFYRESSKPVLMSVNEMLDSVVELLRSRIEAKQAVIERQSNGDVKLTAVAGELRQVFSNLLVNSLDAIEEGGRIRMRVAYVTGPGSGQRSVRVTIADNGKGISAASKQRLFEPFYTTKGAIGTGLGLWVSKQIIDNHAGSIRARSAVEGAVNGVGRGTVFTVTLPVEPAKARGRTEAVAA
jgi:PAS domain S-box-containing protein